eukprot:scaffold92846_cov27-Tisochrysis_lutea.AAC.4
MGDSGMHVECLGIRAHLVVPHGGGRVWPRRVGGGIQLVEFDVAHQLQGCLELLLRLAREAHDRVCSDGGVGNSLADICYDLAEPICRVAAVHVTEDVVIAYAASGGPKR